MTEEEWIKQLRDEGFTDIRVCPIPPNADLPEHTHDVHTVHVILDGELQITDRTHAAETYTSGERVDFLPGTTHIAKGATDTGTMIVGEKKAD